MTNPACLEAGLRSGSQFDKNVVSGMCTCGTVRGILRAGVIGATIDNSAVKHLPNFS